MQEGYGHSENVDFNGVRGVSVYNRLLSFIGPTCVRRVTIDQVYDTVGKRPGTVVISV